MPRSVEEWVGKNDDTPIPPRVKLRIFERYNHRCKKCGLSIVGRLLPAYDHIIALINGGQNRESNIQLLCSECHGPKSRGDVREKSVFATKAKKRLKLTTKRRPLPGSRDSPYKMKVGGGFVRRK